MFLDLPPGVLGRTKAHRKLRPDREAREVLEAPSHFLKRDLGADEMAMPAENLAGDGLERAAPQDMPSARTDIIDAFSLDHPEPFGDDGGVFEPTASSLEHQNTPLRPRRIRTASRRCRDVEDRAAFGQVVRAHLNPAIGRDDHGRTLVLDARGRDVLAHADRTRSQPMKLLDLGRHALEELKAPGLAGLVLIADQEELVATKEVRNHAAQSVTDRAGSAQNRDAVRSTNTRSTHRLENECDRTGIAVRGCHARVEVDLIGPAAHVLVAMRGRVLGECAPANRDRNPIAKRLVDRIIRRTDRPLARTTGADLAPEIHTEQRNDVEIDEHGTRGLPFRHDWKRKPPDVSGIAPGFRPRTAEFIEPIRDAPGRKFPRQKRVRDKGDTRQFLKLLSSHDAPRGKPCDAD